jgi:DNA helicase-2/ATP-dependent DNA helicase PcrA
LAFEKDWPDAAIVKLEENFRSTPNILELADNLIAFNQNRKQKKLIPTRPRARDVCVTACEDEHEEALAVARQIKNLADQGAPLKDIAVFYRVNAMSRPIEEAFFQNKMPYQIVRGVEFYNRKEIRDLLAYLKVTANPDDDIALLRAINTPARGIGKTTIDRVRLYAAQNKISLLEGLKNAERIEALPKAAQAKLIAFVNMLERFRKNIAGKVAPLAESVFVESGLEESLRAAGPDGENAIENVSELISAAAQYDQQAEEPSLIDYLQQISLFSDVDSYDSSSDRVALMTLHAAKGLEFENVFIIGLEDGLLPHERSKESTTGDREDLEEERRLFFVGMTRAKVGLHISHARYRTVRGQMLRTIPSQFLFELGRDLAGLDQEHEFSAGQLVRHKSFGAGRIKKFVDMGENSVVVVEFNSGQTKSLMVKYARLVRVSIKQAPRNKSRG